MMNQEFAGQKRKLELNLGHPVIQNLSSLLQQQKSHPFLTEAVEQLYQNALLVEGLMENPVEMLPRINRLLADASAFQLRNLESSSSVS
jgi:molecular chaperone HtpG